MGFFMKLVAGQDLNLQPSPDMIELRPTITAGS